MVLLMFPDSRGNIHNDDIWNDRQDREYMDEESETEKQTNRFYIAHEANKCKCEIIKLTTNQPKHHSPTIINFCIIIISVCFFF